jgi:hypothetical protein
MVLESLSPSLQGQWRAASKVVVHDIVGIGDISSHPRRRSPPPPPSGDRLLYIAPGAHQVHDGPAGPRQAHQASAALLQHIGRAAIPILAESLPVATTFRKHDEFSAQARPNPYGTQGCLDHCQATTGNHHRNMAPATRHRHHPAMPDCCCSRSAAARDRRDLTRSPWRGEWQAVTADIARAFGGSSKRRGCRSGRPSRHDIGGGVGRGERVSCFRASRQCSC